MKVSKDLNLQNFEFWSGAKGHKFTHEELQEIEYQLEDVYPDGMSETDVNDIFWFEEELLCDWLRIDFEEDYLNR